MIKKKIRTKNREIYEKCNMLNIMPEVIMKNNIGITKIVKNINKHEKILELSKLGKDMILLKKQKPFRFNIYLR